LYIYRATYVSIVMENDLFTRRALFMFFYLIINTVFFIEVKLFIQGYKDQIILNELINTIWDIVHTQKGNKSNEISL